MLDNLTSYLSSSLRHKLQYSANQGKPGDELFSQLSIANILQKYDKGEWTAKSLVTFRSTPNLADISDNLYSNKFKKKLYKNKSTECLANAADHLENFLFNAYQKSSIIESIIGKNEVPCDPLCFQAKKLEDIYKFLNSENTHEVTIRKDSRGLGFSISGGRDSSKSDLFSQLIRISKLYPLQPALASGSLFVGDILLEVNGINMVGLTNTEALEMLRSCDTDVTFKVFRPTIHGFPSLSLCKDFWPVALTSSLESCFHKKTPEHESILEEFEVTLVKQAGALGFTVCKREEANCELKGFYVHNLVREPAISDGRIHPGDFILKVNGACISSLKRDEALLLLRNCPETVTLTLIRPNPPVSPLSLEGDIPLGKPLRWEAIELLNDRKKHKDSQDSSWVKKKLKRMFNAENNSQDENWTEASSFDTRETVSEDSENSVFAAICAKYIEKDTVDEEDEIEEENEMEEADEEAEESSLSGKEDIPEVQTFEVVLNKGWHTRLGFSLCDPPDDFSQSRTSLPMCAEVRAVYPSSLAAKDGRIQVKDRVIEVNSESLLGLPAVKVVDLLRRKTGRIRMVFCRLVHEENN